MYERWAGDGQEAKAAKGPEMASRTGVCVGVLGGGHAAAALAPTTSQHLFSFVLHHLDSELLAFATVTDRVD